MPVLASRLYEGTRQLLIDPFCQGCSLLGSRLGLHLDHSKREHRSASCHVYQSVVITGKTAGVLAVLGIRGHRSIWPFSCLNELFAPIIQYHDKQSNMADDIMPG